MKKSEFDKLFSDCKKMHLPDPEKIPETFLSYSEEGNKVGIGSAIESAAAFAYMESIKYTNDMIYTMLYEALGVENDEN